MGLSFPLTSLYLSGWLPRTPSVRPHPAPKTQYEHTSQRTHGATGARKSRKGSSQPILVSAGDVLKDAKVQSVLSWGAFFDVGNGHQGLLHVDEMILPEGGPSSPSAFDLVKEGQVLEVSLAAAALVAVTALCPVPLTAFLPTSCWTSLWQQPSCLQCSSLHGKQNMLQQPCFPQCWDGFDHSLHAAGPSGCVSVSVQAFTCCAHLSPCCWSQFLCLVDTYRHADTLDACTVGC